MLTCISRPKKLVSSNSVSRGDESEGVKSLKGQLKEMVLKASGACGASLSQSRLRSNAGESDSESERWTWRWGKEMEARLNGISSSGKGTTSSFSGRRVVVPVEEEEVKEWVAYGV